jgi:hypothetical protein
LTATGWLWTLVALALALVYWRMYKEEGKEARLLAYCEKAAVLDEVLSRFVLEFGDAISGISRVPSQAARSIG